MTSNNGEAIIGVFHDARKAQDAVRGLREAGFKDAQIGVLSRYTDEKDEGASAAKGAAVGAGAVGGMAALWSLGISFGVLPVIGPILAAGPLAAALISAAGGAAAGGVVGALAGLGLSEHDAKYYEGELHSGRILVTVHADERAPLAWQIMNGHSAYNHKTATAATR
jgi:hypothetical protein